jgi:monoamine oxidase
MGDVLKVVLRFRTAFWAVKTPPFPYLPGLSFLATPGAIIRTWWTSYPLVAPLVTAWIAGPRATLLAGETESALIDRSLATLAQALGVPPRLLEAELEGGYLHNWQADPFARGAYSYVRVGGKEAPARLAEPVAGTLFFAGEATDADGHTGTVHAALASGSRAAKEIARQGIR